VITYRRWRIVAVSIAALVASACGGSSAPSAVETPTAARPAPSASVREIQGDGAQLEPGTYTFSAFEPRVRFDLGNGWSGGHTNPRFFDAWRGQEFSVVFARPDYVVGKDGARLEDMSQADRVLTVLGGRPAAKPGPAMTVGQVSRPSVALDADSGLLFGSGSDRFSVDAGTRLRITTVQVQNQAVLIMLWSLHGDLESHLPVAQELLRTVRFGSA
jgi:hypothetical protein